jgi:optic atrophy protein 1
MLEERARLQKDIDQLKMENEELHRVNIINAAKVCVILPAPLVCRRLMLPMQTKPDKAKRAIDLFSDILDLRSRVDRGFAAQERLPRVVVVGDQVRVTMAVWRTGFHSVL